MFEQTNDTQIHDSRLALYILLFALAIHCALTLPFIMSFPPVDYAADESWMLNISQSIADNGRPVAPMHVGTPLAREPQIITLWLYNGVLAGVVKLAGQSLFWARLLSWLSGCGALCFTYLLARAMTGRLAGAAATLLLAANIAFSLQSRMVRPETMLICITTAAVYFYYRGLTDHDGRLSLLLSGLLATLSVEVHPNGAIIATTLLIAFPFLYRKHICTLRALSFLVGLGIGTLIWICANLLPFSTSSFGSVHGKYLPPLFSVGVAKALLHAFSNLKAIFSPDALNNFLSFYLSGLPAWSLYVFIVLPALAGLIFPATRRLIALLAGLVLTAQFMAFLLIGEWGKGHPVIFAPYAAIAVAVSIQNIAASRKPWRRTAYFIALMILAAPFIMDVASRDLRYSSYNIANIHHRLAEAIPENARYMGSGIHYFMRGKGSDRYISPLVMEGNCSDFSEIVNRVGAEYVIIDYAFVVLASAWCGEGYKGSIYSFDMNHQSTYSAIIDYPTYYGGNLRFVKVIRVHPPHSVQIQN